ncbi:unnamed protein product [Lactuca saligna]|uniref:Uncharacterized protein n=1 Tax=Lactuca saligna TaxID=75948 RepID=A0AA35ZD68_LACSI|nr:unnamed protein product [Lactuca saligna]
MEPSRVLQGNIINKEDEPIAVWILLGLKLPVTAIEIQRSAQKVNATLNATGRAPFTDGVGLESVIEDQSHISANNDIQQIDNLQSSLKGKSVEILHVDLVLLPVFIMFGEK